MRKVHLSGEDGLVCSEERLGDMFGTVCLLSVMPDPGKELPQLADQDISGSAATSGLWSSGM